MIRKSDVRFFFLESTSNTRGGSNSHSCPVSPLISCIPPTLCRRFWALFVCIFFKLKVQLINALKISPPPPPCFRTPCAVRTLFKVFFVTKKDCPVSVTVPLRTLNFFFGTEEICSLFLTQFGDITDHIVYTFVKKRPLLNN